MNIKVSSCEYHVRLYLCSCHVISCLCISCMHISCISCHVLSVSLVFCHPDLYLADKI